jgi:Skp family chaperone for outer membrane proteins
MKTKKLMQIGILCAGLTGLAVAGWAAEQKIATFNLTKAFNSYYKTIQSTIALRQEAADAKKEESQMIESGRKHDEELRLLIDKANDQAVSAEEREKSKKAADDKRGELESDKQYITEFERRADAHLRAKLQQRTADIVKEIEGVVEARAKTAGYSMVLDSSGESANLVQSPVLLYSNGQDDLTEAIIKELNAAAPPGSLDTNALAVPSVTNLLNTVPPPK